MFLVAGKDMVINAWHQYSRVCLYRYHIKQSLFTVLYYCVIKHY